MGKRGKKPLPVALRLAGGRDLENDPPELPPDDDRPVPPAWLTPLARAKWDALEQDLWAMGCLTKVDESLFAAFCQAWGRYEQGEIDLNASIAAELSKTPKRKVRGKRAKKPGTHGAVAKTAAGNLILNPLFGVVNTLRRDMQRLASEFGLSPSARSVTAGKGGGGSGKKQNPIAKKYFGTDAG